MADCVNGRHCWDQAGKGCSFWPAVELVYHSITLERGAPRWWRVILEGRQQRSSSMVSPAFMQSEKVNCGNAAQPHPSETKLDLFDRERLDMLGERFAISLP